MPGPLTPKLHILTTDEIVARSDFVHKATELMLVVKNHIAIHIRAHHTAAGQLFPIVEKLVPRSKFAGSLLVVNDRVDIAMATQAQAVQLGKRSLASSHVRMIAPSLTIGYSAHGAGEAREAENDGASWVIAGSIYETPSHPAEEPRGLAILDEVVSACSVPVIAVGGITLERVAETTRTGAYGVAVIRAVWDAEEPVHAAIDLVKMLHE